MATQEQIDAVRQLIGDTVAPFTIPDPVIVQAIGVATEEIEDYGVSVTATERGKYALTLLAGYYVVTGHTGNINQRNTTEISEGDARLKFGDLAKNAMTWKTDAMEIVHKIMDIPFDVSTFDDYVEAEARNL